MKICNVLLFYKRQTPTTSLILKNNGKITVWTNKNSQSACLHQVKTKSSMHSWRSQSSCRMHLLTSGFLGLYGSGSTQSASSISDGNVALCILSSCGCRKPTRERERESGDLIARSRLLWPECDANKLSIPAFTVKRHLCFIFPFIMR